MPKLRLALLTAALLTGCSGDSTSPTDSDVLSLLPDFAESLASSVDPGGIGGIRFPDNLALSTEQKAAIAALHEAFKAAIAADVAALRAIETEARAARAAGKSREEIHAILALGGPILERLRHAFGLLIAAIWQVYTPEQRAWIDAHRPAPCGPKGPPPLSEAQIQRIRELQQAFMEEVRADLVLIKQVVEAAHRAAQSGATRPEIEVILHQADAARARVRDAEWHLQSAIEALLTPEQRARKCQAGAQPLSRP